MYILGDRNVQATPTKSGSWYFLGVLFKISDQPPPHPFYMGTPRDLYISFLELHHLNHGVLWVELKGKGWGRSISVVIYASWQEFRTLIFREKLRTLWCNIAKANLRPQRINKPGKRRWLYQAVMHQEVYKLGDLELCKYFGRLKISDSSVFSDAFFLFKIKIVRIFCK